MWQVNGEFAFDSAYYWGDRVVNNREFSESACGLNTVCNTDTLIVAAKLLPQSPMGKAVSYALKQWVYLEWNVDDGDCPIDNNRVERKICLVSTGRKTWLFVDTQNGGMLAQSFH